jgi:hypothetical protein
MRNKNLLIFASSLLSAGLLAFLFSVIQPTYYTKNFAVQFPYVQTKYQGVIEKQYPLNFDEVRELLTGHSFLDEIINDEKLLEKSCNTCVRTSWKAMNTTYITFVIKTKSIQDTQIISDKIKKRGLIQLNLYRDNYLQNQIKPIFPNKNDYSVFDAEVLTESIITTQKYFTWSHFFISILSLLSIFYFVLKKQKN